MNITQTYILSILLSILCFQAAAQEQEPVKLKFLDMPDTVHKVRLWVSAGTGAALYSGLSIGLWNAWYKDYEQSAFHLFDDRGEWENMDKIGHAMTAYNEARFAYKGARWTGLNHKKSVWIAGAIGFGLQGTIEVMDGFSDKWGFSLADIGMNTLGSALFVSQQLIWNEERIALKVSALPRAYPDAFFTSADGSKTMPVQQRADELYGSHFATKVIKDYNTQVYWASINVDSFLKNKDNKFPDWLNVAVGYGAQNMFAGFDYEFTDEEGTLFIIDPNEYPRYRQAYLSLDIDFTRIKAKKRFWQTVLGMIGPFKIPAPALEFSKVGGVKFHPLHW